MQYILPEHHPQVHMQYKYLPFSIHGINKTAVQRPAQIATAECLHHNMATQRLCKEMTPNFARENKTPSKFTARPITSLPVDDKP